MEDTSKGKVKKQGVSLDLCGSVGWVLSHKLKGLWSDSRSGHMPGLWAKSPGGGVRGATN